MGDRAELNEPGQLASALVNASRTDLTIEAVRLPSSADLLVYARRVDNTLRQAHEYCHRNHIPLVVMSTGIDSSLPEHTDYPLVVAPNTNLRVLRYLRRVEEQARHLEGWKIKIIAHQQASKKDTSGTVKKLAAMLGISEDEIISVRNFEDTRAYYESLTEKNRNSYAGYVTTFTNPMNGNRETSDILVLGRDEYAQGLIVISKALQNSEVKKLIAGQDNRIHVVELLKAGYLS
jgi:dihydrodipicolinate reductase